MSATSQALLDSIIRQLGSPTSGSRRYYENVVVGLSADEGNILLTSHGGESSFAKAFKASRAASAVMARVPALTSILADTYVCPPVVSRSAQPYARSHPATEHITVDRNTRLPILGSLASAFKVADTRSAAIVVSYLLIFSAVRSLILRP